MERERNEEKKENKLNDAKDKEVTKCFSYKDWENRKRKNGGKHRGGNWFEADKMKNNGRKKWKKSKKKEGNERIIGEAVMKKKKKREKEDGIKRLEKVWVRKERW